MDTYDESGIGGIDCDALPQAEAAVLEPAALAGAGGGQGWVAMCARDKAGNRSTPLYLPLYGPKSAEAPKP